MEEPQVERGEPATGQVRGQARAIWGVVLVAAGVLFVLGNLVQEAGDVFLLAVGVGFLLAYFLGARKVGFLIPGGIVGGLGVGVLVTRWLSGGWDSLVVLFLGLGFGVIWLFERKHWWSLIPGGVLAAIGVATTASDLRLLLTAEQWQAAAQVLRWWPVLLVALGLWVLFQRARRSA